MLRVSRFRRLCVIAQLWIACLAGAGTGWAQSQSAVITGLENPGRLLKFRATSAASQALSISPLFASIVARDSAIRALFVVGIFSSDAEKSAR